MMSPAHVAEHPKESHWFFHRLKEMVQDGVAKHLVDEFEENQDGHGAMVAIKEWCEGDESKELLADDAQQELDALFAKSGGSFRSHINKFLKCKGTIDKCLDVKWGDSQCTLKFRTNVKCDDCNTAKQIWNSLAKDNKTLQTLVKTCHDAGQELNAKGSTKTC